MASATPDKYERNLSYIEILILRRLRSGPAHGYELRKRVEQTTGFVLHNNSLYPALRRFEEAGAVAGWSWSRSPYQARSARCSCPRSVTQR